MTLFQRYRRRLIETIPIKRYIQRNGIVEKPSQRFGLPQWVISRVDCRFRYFVLTGIPPEQQPAALNLQLLQWSPFAEAAYAIAWDKGSAAVWAWDQKKTSVLMEKFGLKTDRAQLLPESALYAAPENTIRLIKCLDGFEGQIIHQRKIIHSRWWPKTPVERDWTSFMRDGRQSLEVMQNIGFPLTTELRLQKWPIFSLSKPGAFTQKHQILERVLYWGTAGVLMLLTVKQLALWNLYQQSIVDLKTAISAKQLEATPLLRARQEAIAAQEFIQELESFDRFPSQLELLAKVTSNMPRESVNLLEWTGQPGKLKITFTPPASGNGVSAAFLVEALQKGEWFTNVRSVPATGKNVILEMEVKPRVLSPAPETRSDK